MTPNKKRYFQLRLAGHNAWRAAGEVLIETGSWKAWHEVVKLENPALAEDFAKALNAAYEEFQP